MPPHVADTLRVASYNVHFIRADRANGPWSRSDWAARKHGLDAAFKALDADLVGFQELATIPERGLAGENLALAWLRARNPNYGVAAAGDGPDFPSGQAVFYRRDRFRLLDQGWFHCDDPGDGAGSTIDRLLRAREGWAYYCTWARFSTRNGRQFQVFNVHFHSNDQRRQRQAARDVGTRAAPLMERGLPVFVLGDTNALSGWRTVQILRRAGLSIREAIGASFHFNSGLHLFGAIDRIARSPQIEQVGGPWLIDQQFDGIWPSDHYPLVGDFRLP
ncbi:endonuclease/exonuclease/phosphatase family protein [Aliiroseovarius sp.]|uniref:endonuclease/exonuclease/phosphatase family protein n=1 Tax=Aliiroseovarius sp. TaxID=1872442 RepID=UPI002637E8EC|nr:endonuclease/exonuclease/phosphatase family protein [Aliiroseovarius sp.]